MKPKDSSTSQGSSYITRFLRDIRVTCSATGITDGRKEPTMRTTMRFGVVILAGTIQLISHK